MCWMLVRQTPTYLVGLYVDSDNPGLDPANRLFRGIDLSGVEYPDDTRGVQIHVHGILYGCRVTLVVQRPERIRRQDGPTAVLAVQPNRRHGKRYARPEPGHEHESPVVPYLDPGGYNVLGHVPAVVRAGPLDVLAVQRIRRQRVSAGRHPLTTATDRDRSGDRKRHCSGKAGHWRPIYITAC